MKRLILVWLFCLAFLQPSAFANNIAAGEITYEWVKDSTYNFYVKLYRDCSGNSEPITVPLCFHNPCDNSKSFSVTLGKAASTGVTIPIGCSKAKTQCDSAASIYPGYKEWVYTQQVTLPSRCNAWKIFTYVANRNNSVNILNATSNPFYLEASFDNVNFQGNSSPLFIEKPVFYIARTYGVQYSFGYTDIDSVVAEVIQSMTGVSSCAGSATNVSYNSSSPPIGTPHNPFQTNGSFIINNKTRSIGFTLLDSGKNTVALRFKEYRNGVLIGYTIREIQFVALNVILPSMPLFGFVSGPSIICAGQTGNFQFSAFVRPRDPSRIFTFKSLYTISGASINIFNQGTDSVSTSITWTSTINDVGVKNIGALLITDSTCKPPGWVQYSPNAFMVTVLTNRGSLSLIDNDTMICPNTAILLQARGGDGMYSWATIPPGGSSVPQFYHDSAVWRVPDQKTTYVVTSGKYCGILESDTVTIDVNPNTTYPDIFITADPNTEVEEGTLVTLAAMAGNCINTLYQWKLNGINIPGATGITYNSSSLKTNDTITCELTCNDTCAQPKVSESNPLVMSVFPLGIKGKLVQDNHVYPNPNNGRFKITAQLPEIATCDMQITNALGQLVYSENISVTNGALNQDIKLDVSPGVYLLKINGETQRFVVNDR